MEVGALIAARTLFSPTMDPLLPSASSVRTEPLLGLDLPRAFLSNALLVDLFRAIHARLARLEPSSLTPELLLSASSALQERQPMA